MQIQAARSTIKRPDCCKLNIGLVLVMPIWKMRQLNRSFMISSSTGCFENLVQISAHQVIIFSGITSKLDIQKIRKIKLFTLPGYQTLRNAIKAIFYKLPTMLQTALRLVPNRKLAIKVAIILTLAACDTVFVTCAIDSTSSDLV